MGTRTVFFVSDQTGVTAETVYYVKTVPTSGSFTLGTSRSTTAVSGTVNTSGSQSGTHTVRHVPWGTGNGSTTFNTPNLCGKGLHGLDVFGGGNAGLLDWLDALGLVGGEQTHLLTGEESGTTAHGHGNSFAVAKGTLAASSSVNDPGHTHYDSSLTNVAAAGSERTEPGPNNPHSTGESTTGITVTTTISGAPSISGSVSNSSAADASTAHNNMAPTVLVPFIVKT